MSSIDFGEKIHPTDRIREVLNAYPFGTTVIREVLANSDDAQASEQRFALDFTHHPDTKICDPRIADTQGPALLAYNNSFFKDEDWDAIQFIGHSSKAKSTSKIGKFGLGIRSCYHVTDYLQILSGQDLLIFDPMKTFTDVGGVRFTFSPDTIEGIRDHFTAFSHFLPDGWNGERFDGTIVRLPLRTKPGLREKIVSPSDIQDLFSNFINHDLNICLLFVNHLRSRGQSHTYRAPKQAECNVELQEYGSGTQGVDKKVIHLQFGDTITQEQWLMVHDHYSTREVLMMLESQVGTSSLEKVLQGSKLCPDVTIALPLSLEQPAADKRNTGQLFTFLPLPVKTGFPAHVHALFALDSSRQHLCMNRDKGTMQGSENQIYDEWNRVLFKTVIPHAWSRLLGLVAGASHSQELAVKICGPVPGYLFSAVVDAALPSFRDTILASMISALMCGNHVTYRFGKGMMPERYRLDMSSMAVIMDQYANQLAEQYGPEVANKPFTSLSTLLAVTLALCWGEDLDRHRTRRTARRCTNKTLIDRFLYPSRAGVEMDTYLDEYPILELTHLVDCVDVHSLLSLARITYLVVLSTNCRFAFALYMCESEWARRGWGRGGACAGCDGRRSQDGLSSEPAEALSSSVCVSRRGNRCSLLASDASSRTKNAFASSSSPWVCVQPSHCACFMRGVLPILWARELDRFREPARFLKEGLEMRLVDLGCLSPGYGEHISRSDSLCALKNQDDATLIHVLGLSRSNRGEGGVGAERVLSTGYKVDLWVRRERIGMDNGAPTAKIGDQLL
ncbi:hypothetical protein NMY22_g8142 [Coprinellus aureogranulatus]|nr:hypothetical protein NMY22_g8142 [Coprinellus aureogranulatus]